MTPDTTARISIVSAEDLERLAPPRLKPVTVKVHFKADNLDEHQRRNIERKLSRNLSACGCGEGAALGLLYLVGLSALLIAGAGPASLFQWFFALTGLCIAVIAGKLAGIGVAHMRLSHQNDR